MPDMDVDPPDRQTLCSKRDELYSTIETSGILIENFNEVINVPDTPQNHQMKEIVKKQIREHQQGKDAALAELDTIPPLFLSLICIANQCDPSWSRVSVFITRVVHSFGGGISSDGKTPMKNFDAYLSLDKIR
ncbi:hypothetical protein TNCT_73711 [Trichonephila clavata]|uniref:Uncharacterized protein n=1 Tax=Trichonephila clavata TaxID=2740835 RepID=A0A8X6HIV3_TRICU|nr:hypothetical protein TNCT_73711 [Trichonephila clavata]